MGQDKAHGLRCDKIKDNLVMYIWSATLSTKQKEAENDFKNNILLSSNSDLPIYS